MSIYNLFQVRTLFVSGLPMDTKPRELYLLFRAYEVMLKSLIYIYLILVYFGIKSNLRLLLIYSIVVNFQGYEGSLLKVTSKNGKTSSVSKNTLKAK